MVEDRVALKEMHARDFYPEGLDEGSVEVVREDARQKSSGLAKDTTFDFGSGPAMDVISTALEDEGKAEEEIFVRPDTP